ncbi:MAG: hypothetical protein MUF52_15965, partial [Syntrophobacteraceae bacterium]|nr:hypothetical protein [Syntrophobacteraceae bacterium]
MWRVFQSTALIPAPVSFQGASQTGALGLGHTARDSNPRILAMFQAKHRTGLVFFPAFDWAISS